MQVATPDVLLLTLTCPSALFDRLCAMRELPYERLYETSGSVCKCLENQSQIVRKVPQIIL